MVATVIAVILACVAGIFLDKSFSNSDLWGVVAAIIILLLTILLSYKLVIVIDKETLFFSLGVGLIRKVIYLSDIEECDVVKIFGVGIKGKLRATVYNIVFAKYGVMILRNNSRRKIILGAKNAEEIKAAIDDAIKALKEKKNTVDYYYRDSY